MRSTSVATNHSGRWFYQEPRPTPSFAHQNADVQKKGFLVCKQQKKIALISNRHDSGGKNVLLFHITLGIYEVFLERSGRKIWVKPEPRAEPYIPCYMSRPKRSVGRAQRGTERSGVSLSQEHYIKERGKNLFPLKVITISNKWTI